MIDQNTRILVLGCGGMLGEAIHETFKDRVRLMATDIDVHEPWLSALDIRDREGLNRVVAEFRPQIVINLAALVDLEYCERHPHEAYATNAVGTENSALIAAREDLTYVYISTAGIFDGKQDIYNDYDLPVPLSVYGKSKYAGELFVQQAVKKHYVFRAGWMMGGGPRKDKKFVNKIVQQLKTGKQTLNVVEDKLGTPTYTFDFAATMLEVLGSEQYGLYNMVSDGQCSRHEVATEIVRHFGLLNDIHVNSVDSSFWQAEYFAPRPASEQLVNLKLNLKGLNRMRHWKESLEAYLSSHDWQVPRPS